MNEPAARSMALLCDALDKEEYQYFCSSGQLTAYSICRPRLRHRKLWPFSLKLTVTPQDTGLLFEASLPVALRPANDEELSSILLSIARENFSTMRGALAYRPASGLLYYRLFYALTGPASEFSAEEAVVCLKLCSSSLSDGYTSIVNALDARRPSEDTGLSEEDSGKVRADLEALFDRLFAPDKTGETDAAPTGEADGEASSVTGTPDSAAAGEDSGGTPEEAGDAPGDGAPHGALSGSPDGSAQADSGGDGALNEELLALLNDILEKDDPSD